MAYRHVTHLSQLFLHPSSPFSAFAWKPQSDSQTSCTFRIISVTFSRLLLLRNERCSVLFFIITSTYPDAVAKFISVQRQLKSHHVKYEV